MKRFVPLLGVAAVTIALGACSNAGTPTATDDNGSTASVAVDINLPPSDASSADSAASVDPASQARVIDMTAEDFAFKPNAITLKKGEKAVIRLTGINGDHGIGIPGLGISQTVDAGQTVMIDIPTDKTGTFDFFCNVPCGPGHKDMTGTITIS